MPNEPFDTLIINGLVVANGRIMRADVGIRAEKIADVRTSFDTSPSVAAARVIDASGKYIFPGIIDAHVHPIYLDDKYDTSVSAAFGERMSHRWPVRFTAR